MDFYDAAGRRIPLPEKLCTRIRAEYETDRLPIRAIGKLHGFSYGKTRSLLVELGVNLRPRGGARGPRPRP
mgnify:CR=1 FL=1